MPRTFAVGDVHGCDVALETLLTVVDLHAGDALVQLGDLCDRGPDTARVIDLLIALGEEIDLRVILGNHDEMMLGAVGRRRVPRRRAELGDATAGRETLASYGGVAGDVPAEHVRFLEAADRWRGARRRTSSSTPGSTAGPAPPDQDRTRLAVGRN